MSQRPRLIRWLRVLGVLAGLLATVTLSTTSGCASFGAFTYGSHLPAMEASKRYQGGKFHNVETTDVMPRGKMWEATKEYLSDGSRRHPSVPLPLYQSTTADLAKPPATGLRVTWFGHSSTLLEVDGIRVLTDPHWSERASPSTLVGPHRFHPPVVPLSTLGHLDAVLISHDHYDHLDMETVQQLAKTGVKFLVGLGVGAHLEAWGIPAFQITECDWWQEIPFPGGVRIVSTPGRHFSGRLFPESNPTLWTSWAVVGPSHRVYFSGDTGMSPHMAEIGSRLGPFDLTMLEIGQFHPAWGDIHLGPEGALQAHAALKGNALLPIHWCTFELGLHGWSEPAEDAYVRSKASGVALLTPMLGQPVEPASWVTAETPWWRDVHEAH